MRNTAFDGYFKITEHTDGHYLEVYAPVEDGRAVTFKEIENALRSAGIKKIDEAGIRDALLNIEGQKIIKVSEAIHEEECDELEESLDTVGAQSLYRIEISDNWMEAYIRFSAHAKNKKITVEEIIEQLEQRDIRFGIKEDYIKEILLEHKCNVPYVIAQGKQTIPAVPGHIEYFFDLKPTMKPEIDENGNVNFHKLSVICLVKEKQLLARLSQTKQGTPGMNLRGRELLPAKGQPVRIRHGKNTYTNDEKTELYAETSGLVKYIDKKVIVNNVYEVAGNIGSSTGDIEFDGSIVIYGHVMTGYRVEATGDIEVVGGVEGATLISGGSITLHSGIQGRGKSHLQCAENLSTKFIEQADVVCKGNIYSEAILHSKVACKGEIIVEGKKSMISGGVVRAGKLVETRTLGSHMGTSTDIEVGIEPALLDEYNTLRKDINKAYEVAEELEKVITLLNKRKELSGELDDEKTEMYKSAVRNKVFLTNKITKNQQRVEELREEVENRNAGVVKILGSVYPGVRIGIGNSYYFVQEEIKYTAFYKKGGDIRLRAL